MTTRRISAGIVAALLCGVAAAPPFTAEAQPASSIELTPIGVHDSGVGEGGSEIVAFDHRSDLMIVTNGASDVVDVVDISDPSDPVLVHAVDMSPYGDGIQSVAVGRRGLMAAAVKHADGTRRGSVVTFGADGEVREVYRVGVLPDAIEFTPNGRFIVVANEAEPVCDGETLDKDPKGWISIIDTRRQKVRTAGFARWVGREDALRARGVRVFFPGSDAAQDLEPEYVAISPNGRKAFVTLQENNAIAVVDIAKARVTRILPLGTKDHSIEGAGLDPSNEDGGIEIGPWDVEGMYQPDSIAVLPAGERNRRVGWLVTANEGDARDYDCYSEEVRVADLGLGAAYPEGADADDRLGRLKTTTAFPTTVDADGRIEQVYAYGARSFSIWTSTGELAFDSGDALERITADLVPELFNADDGDPAAFDQRSDDKGPEPEALAVGRVDGRWYAFVGLERTGGVAVFDITEPADSVFVTYLSTTEDLGDVSPEGIEFVPASKSPSGTPLLLVSHELSGTTRVLEIG